MHVFRHAPGGGGESGGAGGCDVEAATKTLMELAKIIREVLIFVPSAQLVVLGKRGVAAANTARRGEKSLDYQKSITLPWVAHFMAALSICLGSKCARILYQHSCSLHPFEFCFFDMIASSASVIAVSPRRLGQSAYQSFIMFVYAWAALLSFSASCPASPLRCTSSIAVDNSATPTPSTYLNRNSARSCRASCCRFFSGIGY